MQQEQLIPIDININDETNMFTVPQEVYIQMYEADFCSKVYFEESFIIINLGRIENNDNVKFTILIMRPESEKKIKNNVYSCNLYNNNGNYEIRAQQAVKYVVYQRFGFQQAIKNNKSEDVQKKWTEKLKQANDKVLTYVKIKTEKI